MRDDKITAELEEKQPHEQRQESDGHMPKILLISAYAPPMIGGPQNLFNLFCEYPEDACVVLTRAYAIDSQSGTSGAWLPHRYLFIDQEGPWKPAQASPPEGGGPASIREWVAKWVARMPAMLQVVIDALLIPRATAAYVRKIRRVLEEQATQLLVGVSDEGPALWATYRVHRRTGLPFALFFFDLYLGNRLRGAYRWLARWLEPRLMRSARLVIVTNEATKQYLHQRYGARLPCLVVPNSALPEAFIDARRTTSVMAPPRIVFTGNVYWAQEGGVFNLIRAMDHLRDLSVQLDLYVPRPTIALRDEVGKRTNVELKVAPQARMPEIQCSASLLVLALAWDTDAPDIIATATPGKLTDYLASGRPILVHAPPNAAVTRMAREEGFALIADENDPLALSGVIRAFFDAPGIDATSVEKALARFERHHDARRNAKCLWRELARVAERIEPLASG